MIAIDTNLLVYAHRSDSDWHKAALKRLKALAEGSARWAIPWPCVHEFLAIVTHPRIYQPATQVKTAVESVEVWLSAPGCSAIGEGPGYFDLLKRLLGQGQTVGGLVHDARIAAICLLNGVRELWTVDRDFSRFPALKTHNPLVH